MNKVSSDRTKGKSFLIQKSGQIVGKIKTISVSKKSSNIMIIDSRLTYEPIKQSELVNKQYDYRAKTVSVTEKHNLPQITINLPIRQLK
jgi:hypothetical protein